MRGAKMIYKLLKSLTVVDITAFTLFFMSLYLAFFTNESVATIYMFSVTMFFFGVGFIVDAIAKIEHNVVIVISSEQGSDKPTIQE
jgi:hypothetical protein